MRIHQAVVLPLMILFLSGCVVQPPRPPRPALEIRAMQTRSYTGVSERVVMKALLNTLQDEGFIVRNAVPEVGLVTASKETDRENVNDRILTGILMGEHARWNKVDMLEATANITDVDGEIRVRVSFHNKLLDNQGGVVSVNEVGDPNAYRNFFSRMEKGVFLQRERL